MKKNLLPLIALISFTISYAQTKEKGAIEITPKIGYSSFTENNEGNSTDSKSGIAYGATADFYFNNRWSLRSGLILNEMGSEYNYLGASYEDKLNYLSIPINANWHFGSTRKWNLNFGLSPSFLLDAKVNNTEIPKNTIESFQLGLTFGIGYKIEITEKFGILLDYQVFSGLTNINKATDSSIKNSGDSFNIGGVFQL
jgi:hypothetical protein